MIPSDHFVRFYNEVFKALAERGREHLEAYWREIGRLQTAELADKFRAGGLDAAADFWRRALKEENCDVDFTETDDYFEFRMKRCPSLSKVMDNDCEPFELYCDHCMGWIQPLMEACGLYAVMDIESRTEPHCTFRVYSDAKKAEVWARQARLLARPYPNPAAR